MPTKNITETVSPKGETALRNLNEGNVELKTGAGATNEGVILDETDFVSAVLEYADARGILPALLKAMPTRKRRSRKKPERKAA